MAREAEAFATARERRRERCVLGRVSNAATAFATCGARSADWWRRDVARAAESTIRRFGSSAEGSTTGASRVGDLLAAVLDAHVAACADYETRLAHARARPPSDGGRRRRTKRRLRAEVERLLGDMALERASNSSSPGSAATNKLYRTPDVKSAGGRLRGAELREIEAERRELQETLAEVQRRMRALAESSDAIESELREQLDASRRKESAELRDPRWRRF